MQWRLAEQEPGAAHWLAAGLADLDRTDAGNVHAAQSVWGRLHVKACGLCGRRGSR